MEHEPLGPDVPARCPALHLVLPDAGLHDVQHLAVPGLRPRSSQWLLLLWLEKTSPLEVNRRVSLEDPSNFI